MFDEEVEVINTNVLQSGSSSHECQMSSDLDVNHLRSYVAKLKLIEVYIEFQRTNLHTYVMSPNPEKNRIEEIVGPPSCSRRLCIEWIDTTTVEPPVF
uniref:Uncharacterized protein n=1 Tax=Lactuca sativa TaxID=4236 RepID=A0A9R1WGM3_LACSA|nr:hypothetical protein LSAT_V11C100017030 [Lactuca sativa]